MITTTARDLKIALLEARQRELVEASKIEVINTDGLPEDGPERLDAVAGRLLQLLPAGKDASMLELRRRAALFKALQAEYIKAENELEVLRRAKADAKFHEEANQRRAKAEAKRKEQEFLSPNQFARGFAWLLLCAGVIVGTAAGVDALAGNRSWGYRHLSALGVGYLACLGMGEAKRIRWANNKSKK